MSFSGQKVLQNPYWRVISVLVKSRQSTMLGVMPALPPKATIGDPCSSSNKPTNRGLAANGAPTTTMCPMMIGTLAVSCRSFRFELAGSPHSTGRLRH